MSLEEWNEPCRKAWENDFEYLQIDKFDKKGAGRYVIRNCNKTKFIGCTSQTKPF